MEKLYRVEDTENKRGLWRWFDGTYEPMFDVLHEGKCKDVPMPDSDFYRRDGKAWFASAPTKETLKVWFSRQDIDDLAKHGFKIYEFIVTSSEKVSEVENVFTRDSILSMIEIPADEVFGNE